MEVENWDVIANVTEITPDTNGYEASEQLKIIVEVLLRQSSNASESTVVNVLRKRIRDKLNYARGTSVGSISLQNLRREMMVGINTVCKDHVESICFEDAEGKDSTEITNYSDYRWCFYVYKMQNEATFEDSIGEDVTATVERVLPSREYFQLWESLVYDSCVKRDLLNYAMTTVHFSELNIDSNLITWNKVILLHGPPGTGKTSLCRALAQKLSIRLTERYHSLHFIEINSHSLFSRWFSESGKLVMKLFEKIETVVRTPGVFVCLLIDEVESLARARQASLSGNEPSDAVRAVNALLTQIDKIKQYPNILIFTTSNISEAIDLAFVDRADIKQYIGNPSEDAIMVVCISCLEELIRKGVLNSDPSIYFTENDNATQDALRRVAKACQGLSGRSLRKLPFLTIAEHFSTKIGIGVAEFLDALNKTAKKYQADSKALRNGTSHITSS
ncbi:pachytene checkpoint protein 2 homolog [Paramacrobiotus metropolitanus]|uniref:pachytene checkpoint protein 2 homolog n=1 Tax=Paramacrobiotus metropolitanus TaxID=2943436 RepID=UPI00244580E5|nr:pachytene checkpoint protein 2 homolog [Paramacrobiotus metropolitanus]